MEATYFLPGQEAHTFEENKAAPAHMDRSNERIPKRDGQSLQKSKRTMVFVETPHWGDNDTTSTEKEEPNRGPHHQQPGTSGIHCTPPHYLYFDVATAPHHEKGGQHCHRSMARRGSISLATTVVPILKKAAWISRQTQTH